MKWRNTKERELLTSSSASTNMNQVADGTESASPTKHCTSNDKNEICALSNDCYDCQQDKEDTMTFRPSYIVNHDETSSTDADVKNDSRK